MMDICGCVCCGAIIPEGRQHCPICERNAKRRPDVILKDVTPLYLKTSDGRGDYSVQEALYEQLLGYQRAMDKED